MDVLLFLLALIVALLLGIWAHKPRLPDGMYLVSDGKIVMAMDGERVVISAGGIRLG